MHPLYFPTFAVQQAGETTPTYNVYVLIFMSELLGVYTLYTTPHADSDLFALILLTNSLVQWPGTRFHTF